MSEETKPYYHPKHLRIDELVREAQGYIRDNLKDADDNDKFARLPAGVLEIVIMELVALYGSFSTWLAHEKLHIADLKAEYEVGFSHEYLKQKRSGETNETARHEAKLAMASTLEEVNKYTHLYNLVEAEKKTIGRYHDSVRSTFSYEKQQEAISRGAGV